MEVNVVLEEDFDGHQGNDLYDLKHAHYRVFHVQKETTVAELMETLAEHFKFPLNKLRPWPFSTRSNETCRPTCLDISNDQDKTVSYISGNMNPWNIFLEMLLPDSGLTALPKFDKENDVLVFFKLYDPKEKRLHYCGHHYLRIASKITKLIPVLNKQAGFPADTPLNLYEEIKPDLVQKIAIVKKSVRKVNGMKYQSNITLILPEELVVKPLGYSGCVQPVEAEDKMKSNLVYVALQNIMNIILDEIMDGDIIVFERADLRHDELELPTCQDYFNYIFNKIEVKIVEMSHRKDPGFTMELSKEYSYEQIAHAVGQRLNVDPYLIQFFQCQNCTTVPNIPLKFSYKGKLKNLLIHCKQKCPKKLFYQIVSIKVNELDNKKQFFCLWVGPNYNKNNNIILYPNKNGKVADILEEAAKVLKVSPEGSGSLRIVEVSSHKVKAGPDSELPLDQVTTSPSRLYRIEEIPKDELELQKDEILVPCAHYDKEVHATFGIPFFIRVKQSELLQAVKDRLQKKLAIPDNEWEKYKFAVVTNDIPNYNIEGARVNIYHFRARRNTDPTEPRSWLGLDHNKKTSRK